MHNQQYLLLPGQTHLDCSYPDLLVGVETIFPSQTWEQAHFSLANAGCQMLTPRQFVDFVSHLTRRKVKDERGKTVSRADLDSIISRVLQGSDSLREEWLDMRFFGSSSRSIEVRYGHRTDKGKLFAGTKNQPVWGTLSTYAISPREKIDLTSCNFQGLPRRKGKDWLYYPPIVDVSSNPSPVVSFRTMEDSTLLNCLTNPQATYPFMRVRPVKVA